MVLAKAPDTGQNQKRQSDSRSNSKHSQDQKESAANTQIPELKKYLLI